MSGREYDSVLHVASDKGVEMSAGGAQQGRVPMAGTNVHVVQ